MTSLLFIGYRRVIKMFYHSCNNTSARKRNVTDNIRVNNAFYYLNIVHFEGDKIQLYTVIR